MPIQHPSSRPPALRGLRRCPSTRWAAWSAVVVTLAASAAPARAAGAADGPPVLAPDAPVAVPARPWTGGPRAEEARVVQLGLPAASRYAAGTPERAVAEWLTAWRQRAWDRMRVWSAPVPRPALTAADLRERFWTARLDGWLLRDLVQDGARARADVVVALHPALRMVEQRTSLPVQLRRRGNVWQVRATDVRLPVEGALGERAAVAQDG